VANLNKALRKAKDIGFWVAGAVVEGGKPLGETEFPLPIALVVGSEQKGIRDVLKGTLDLEVTIPMSSETISFNVAHATTVLCYEITRQKLIRKKDKLS
jgi:23S rRNA (guanosine2251-2'-O)-methyltransferase